MSCYYRQNGEALVTIPNYTESSNGVIYYDIKVKFHDIEWLVERRYKDFDQLNEKLIGKESISKNLLPPKKIVGKKCPTFLEQRRQLLEKYLQELLTSFQMQLPHLLAEFLDFNKYDIAYILEDLAKFFNDNGELLLSKKKEYNLSALEVFAISERLCLPCPPESNENKGKYDFSHVLDFCSQLEILIVTPIKDNTSGINDYNTIDVPIERSNIIPKKLCFNLNAFRSLKTLKFFGLSMENIIDIAPLKPTLKSIYVHHTTITGINQVLMCDNIHKDAFGLEASSNGCTSAILEDTRSMWKDIEVLDLSGNLLTHIDSSISTAPQVRKLVLEQNRIKAIQNLANLPHLRVLSLCANLILDCTDWHLLLGNLATLNLAQNKIKRLSGLRKLLSLENLDLSCNAIEDLDEVDNIACLPILETLRLTGNPLAGSVDYRSRVLARFHERAIEITLDSERGTQKELDTALVLSALMKSKLHRPNSGHR